MTNTTYRSALTAECVEHARRHGFTEHEDFGAALVLWTPARAAAMWVRDDLSTSLVLELFEEFSSRSTLQIEMQQGLQQDAADFLDELEGVLVKLKGRVNA